MSDLPKQRFDSNRSEVTAGVEIALATAGDLDEVHGLELIAFPAPWRREFFESELRGSGRFNLVARRGKHVIGYVFTMWYFDEMHVNKIAVNERERRKGIADSLMTQCLIFARAHAKIG